MFGKELSLLSVSTPVCSQDLDGKVQKLLQKQIIEVCVFKYKCSDSVYA